MAMKHFVILETENHDRLSLPIEDITSIDGFTKDECTTVYTEKHFYYVSESVEEITKRINQIVYGTEK